MNPQHYKVSDARIRWAYLFEEVKPLKTSSCALFWRCAVLSPLKILAPGAFATVLLYVCVGLLVAVFAPAYAFPGLPAEEGPSRPHAPMPWQLAALFWSLAMSVTVLLIGQATGFWDWLRENYCAPVEIEGGLVSRGSCPKCVGRMVEAVTGDWECLKCHGHFIPNPKSRDTVLR